MKPTISILCTGNSCRSHLAQGILQRALGEDYDVQSAGSKPAGYVHPLAVKAMAEIGPGDYITSLEVTASKAPSAVEYSPAVDELVAMGAAIASNCEPCLKYHYREAEQLGVSKADMARAVAMGAKVKDSPHQAILRLADKLTGAGLSGPADASDKCCGSQGEKQRSGASKCCG